MARLGLLLLLLSIAPSTVAQSPVRLTGDDFWIVKRKCLVPVEDGWMVVDDVRKRQYGYQTCVTLHATKRGALAYLSELAEDAPEHGVLEGGASIPHPADDTRVLAVIRMGRLAGSKLDVERGAPEPVVERTVRRWTEKGGS